MTRKKLGCDYIGHDFGAHYPDSTCIDGYLWDMDSGFREDDNWYYTSGGDMPCPCCNREVFIKGVIDDLENEGYNSVDRPITVKAIKHLMPAFPSNERRKLKRYWWKGRREAMRDAIKEG